MIKVINMKVIIVIVVGAFVARAIYRGKKQKDSRFKKHKYIKK